MSRSIKRRAFLQKAGILAGSAVSLPFFSCSVSDPSSVLKILVLGGTNFLGPAIVKQLIAQGHSATLFNRGITNSHLFPELARIRGDRNNGLDGYAQLKGDLTKWDVVIDVWPENPHYVEEAIKVLKARTGHYLFISSIAVYRGFSSIGMDENALLREGTVYEEGNYNLNKMLCEKMVENHFPERFTILRPGAIVGDRDPGPFPTYILDRMVNRKEIMAPDSNDPVQLIDADDIGRFVVKCSEEGLYGHYNLLSHTMGYKDMLESIRKTLNSQVEIHWMLPDFLLGEADLEPFLDIPFWIPLQTDPEPGFYQISNEKAMANGLQLTAFETTVRTSYDSFVNQRFIPEEDTGFSFGISAEREDEIIRLWKAQKG